MSIFTLTHNFLASQINLKKSRSAILQLREKKFRHLLKYAYQHSEFYRALYQESGLNKSDLMNIPISELPTINKKQMMNNFDTITTTNDFTLADLLKFIDCYPNPQQLYQNEYHVVHTSGSSGFIGVFVYNQKDWTRFFPYSTRLFDFRFQRNRTAFFGATDGHYIGVSFNAWLSKGITKLFAKPLILDITNPLKESLDQLNYFQPTILGGYFTGLKILAEQQKKGFLHIRPQYIVSCGEGVIPLHKTYIEQVFDAPFINLYGLAECPILGVGKNEYHGIYLMDDVAYLEMIDNQVFLTNLLNYTQPLIRYRLNDCFIKKLDIDQKLPFTLVNEVIGRSEAMIWLYNNKDKLDFIHPNTFVEFFVPGLHRFQIVVHNAHSFDFLAEIKKDFSPQETLKNINLKLKKLLQKKQFTQIKYSIRIVNHLSIDKKTGKFRLVIPPSEEKSV